MNVKHRGMGKVRASGEGMGCVGVEVEELKCLDLGKEARDAT